MVTVNPPVVVSAETPAAAAAAVQAVAAAHTISTGRLIAGAVLAVGVLAVLISLRRTNKKEGNGYRLTDLLLGDDGKASPSRHVLFGSFFITSWVVVYAALAGKLSDLMFGAYLAGWVTPAVTKLIVGPKDAPPSP